MATKFDSVRNEIMQSVKDLLISQEHEVLITGSQEYCLPITNNDGDEAYLVITFKIPKGSRDGDEYDGYAMAQEYEIKCKDKAERAAKKARDKAAKIAKDKAERAKKEAES